MGASNVSGCRKKGIKNMILDTFCHFYYKQGEDFFHERHKKFF